MNDRLRPMFGSIWLVGGGAVSGACLRLGLAGEVRFYILPVLVSDGVLYFPKFHRDVAFHVTEVRGYKSGMVELCYEVRGYGAV